MMSLGVFAGANVLLELLFQLTGSSYRAFDYVRFNLRLVTAYSNTLTAGWTMSPAVQTSKRMIPLFAHAAS